MDNQLYRHLKSVALNLRDITKKLQNRSDLVDVAEQLDSEALIVELIIAEMKYQKMLGEES